MTSRQAAELFRGLLEAAPDAIIIHNREGVIELFNSQTERMFGYTRQELAGKPIGLLLPGELPSIPPLACDDLESASSAHCPGADRRIPARRKDGTEFPAKIVLRPLQTRDGLLIIASIRDASEQARAEEFTRHLKSELEARVQERTDALRKANDKLRKEIAARHRLEKEILEISDREQRRIGRDLHDDLGQQLVGISYMSHLLASTLDSQSSPEAPQARKITESLQHALALTRSLARGLHPVALESGGLLAALADLAGRTADIFQIQCEFAGPPDDPQLSENMATHLYRIAQEAVTNAVNHGKATCIRICLDSQAGRTSLVVSDNGSGMPAKTMPRRGGLGMRIMQYRAGMIDGTLDISSPASGGVIIACTIPGSGNPA